MSKFSFLRAFREVQENSTTPKRVAVTIVASILLLFGIIGTFIPLVPARLIAAPAFILFSMYSPNVYGMLKRKTDGHPRIQSWLDRVRNWVIHRLH